MDDLNQGELEGLENGIGARRQIRKMKGPEKGHLKKRHHKYSLSYKKKDRDGGSTHSGIRIGEDVVRDKGKQVGTREIGWKKVLRKFSA